MTSPAEPEPREEDPLRTAVVERRRGEAQPGTLGRLGAYALVREISRAPSAWFVEALDALGHPLVLQIARLSRAASPAEKLERQHFERSVLAGTARLSDDPDIGLIAHGGVDRPDGTRVLFWALPKLAPGESVRPARSLEELLRAARALAARLARRHAQEHVDLLLSEAAVLLGGPEGARLLGAPVSLSARWLEADMLTHRLAPEEILSAVARPAGDLWRLGQTLRSLAGELSLPPLLAHLLEALCRPDPRDRVPRASEALVELEAITHELSHERHEGASTTHLAALSPAAVSDLLLEATADSTHLEAALPAGLLALEEQATTAEAPRALPAADPAEVITILPPITLSATAEPIPPPVVVVPPLFPKAAGGAVPDPRREEPTFIEQTLQLSRPPELSGGDPLNTEVLRAAGVKRDLTPRPWMVGALAGLATLGALLFAVRGAAGPADEPRRIGLEDEIVLDALPAPALVISESDGRVLGRTPLPILVPEGANAGLLLALEGHEPQRVVLPGRGRLLATLSRAGGPPCRRQVRAPAGTELEHADGRPAGTAVEVEQAGVLRARAGADTVGAWIVRCGAEDTIVLSPRRPPAETALEVVGPPGAQVEIDGDPAGAVPARRSTRASFSRVRVIRGQESEERWVASGETVTVDLSPRPVGAAAALAP